MKATVPKEKRVVPEDYFRVMKQRKEAEGSKKPRIGSAVPRSVLQSVRGGRNNSPTDMNTPPGLSYLIQVIHPDMDDEEAIELIELS